MTYGIRRGSVLMENIAANRPNAAMNQWMSRRKMICWKCQKDVPTNLGKFSFIVKPSGSRMTAGTSPRKFICFGCRPQEDQKEGPAEASPKGVQPPEEKQPPGNTGA